VIGLEQPICAAGIGYSLVDGVVAEEVCYWRDMTLLPHFLNLLRRPFVQARVHFSEIAQPAVDRKELARQLHGEVLRLKFPPSVERAKGGRNSF
jgi:hypothetical protein